MTNEWRTTASSASSARRPATRHRKSTGGRADDACRPAVSVIRRSTCRTGRCCASSRSRRPETTTTASSASPTTGLARRPQRPPSSTSTPRVKVTKLSIFSTEVYLLYQLLSFSSLTLSPPIPLTLYTLPYWSNPPFLISDIRALWRSGLSARAPECQKLKMVG